MIEIFKKEYKFVNNQHTYMISYYENNERTYLCISRDFELTDDDILEIIKSFEDA